MNEKGIEMIYKVFYQETKERNPRRENTHSLYLDIDAKNELEGRIKARKLVEEKTPYNVELITLLSDKHLEYEIPTGLNTKMRLSSLMQGLNFLKMTS